MRYNIAVDKVVNDNSPYFDSIRECIESFFVIERPEPAWHGRVFVFPEWVAS